MGHALGDGLEVAVGIVLVIVDHEAGGVGQQTDRALVVGLVEIALAATLLGQRLIASAAVAIAGDERVGAVVLQQDVLAVVNIAGDGAGHVLLDAAAQTVITVAGRGEVREGDLDQSILSVVVVGGDAAGAGAGDLGRLVGNVAVDVVAVAERVVLGEPVGGIGDVRPD